MDNISVQDKELDQLLEKVNKALNIKQVQTNDNTSKLKEAIGSQEEADIKNWVSSTIDDWRRSWDDSREGAESAKYDLETVVDWFLNNLDEFEETYGYSLDTDSEALIADIAQRYAEETLDDLKSSWDHFEDSDFDNDDSDNDEDEDYSEDDEDEESWDESLAVIQSKLREYKHNDLEQLFNKIDNTLQETDTYLSSKGYKQFQEAKHTSDINKLQGNLTKVSQGIKNVKLEMKNLQDQVAAGQKSRDEAQQEMNALKQQLQDLMTAQQKAQEEAAKQAKLAKLQARPITDQDAKLGQSYINKALTTGDISKKINKLLPKISPTFKGENFNIKKITRVSSKNPNTLKFKVDFALEGGSNKANKLLDSQDSVTRKATAFLWTLQEDQLSEGIMGAIGSAVGKAIGGIKQGVADLKSNITNNSQQQPNLNNYAAAQKQEPMLAQYLQKILAQAFQDVVPINGKNFDINISNIKAETNAEASKDQVLLAAQQKEQEEKAQADKNQASADKQAKKVQVAADKQAKKDQKTVDKNAQKAKDEQIKTSQFQQAAFGNDLNTDLSDKVSAELNAKESTAYSEDHLYEGLLVKDGSFTIEMTLANGNAGQAQQAQIPQEAAPQQQPAQQPQPKIQPAQAIQQQAQPQANAQPAQTAQQQAQQPNGQSINIYNNGYPQQGQPQQRAQNTGIPDWNNLSRGQKKFLRKANKAAKKAGNAGRTPRNGNLGDNLWDLTYGNGGKYGSSWA